MVNLIYFYYIIYLAVRLFSCGTSNGYACQNKVYAFSARDFLLLTRGFSLSDYYFDKYPLHCLLKQCTKGCIWCSTECPAPLPTAASLLRHGLLFPMVWQARLDGCAEGQRGGLWWGENLQQPLGQLQEKQPTAPVFHIPPPNWRTPASLCLLACSESLLCVLTPHVMNWGIVDRVWGVRTHDKAHKMPISTVSQPFIHPIFILFIFVGHNYFWHGVSLEWIVMGSYHLSPVIGQ